MESRILIIHPGALGDVLQTVPALRGLRAAAPRRTARLRGPAAARRACWPRSASSTRRAPSTASGSRRSSPTSRRRPRWPGRPGRLHARGLVVRLPRADLRARASERCAADAIVARPVPDDDTPVWRHCSRRSRSPALAEREAVAPIRPAAPRARINIGGAPGQRRDVEAVAGGALRGGDRGGGRAAGAAGRRPPGSGRPRGGRGAAGPSRPPRTEGLEVCPSC